MAGERVQAHVVARGLVQGVYFRMEARDRARSLGVDGWARNAADGSFEAVFEGPRERVESMVEWCRRGPSGARVDELELEWEAPGDERDFSIGG